MALRWVGGHLLFAPGIRKAHFRVLPPADARYAAIRAALDVAGTPIAPNGLLIAAHAVGADVTLVTVDVGALERVEGLRIENLLA